MIDLKEMGLRIRQKRIELNITQEELAKRVGYTSRSSINKIELGLVNLPQSKIISISDALNVSTSYIMGIPKFKIGTRLNKNIAHNIRHHREQANLTQEQFADMLGVDQKTVALIESGEEALSEEMLFMICDALQLIPCNIMPTDEEELSQDTKYLLSRRERGGFLPLNLQLFAETRPITTKKLPMLGNVACGEPIFANESHESYVDASADVDADFCLTAKGDSMINARIFDGDILFVKSQSIVNDGEIAVVLIEDEATVKRVYYDRENNTITLAPENPLYKPMRYTGTQLDQIRILGKVVSGQYRI